MLSTLERQIRMVIGVSLIMLGGIKTSFLLAILGFAVLITGLYNFCPLYRIFKIKPGDKDKK